MHSNTFHFDGHNLSDFGCIICNYENNDVITVEGGNIEYITTKTPNSNKNSQVGNEYADPYRFTFSIMKSVCQANHGEDYFTIPEQTEILKWLVKENGYGISKRYSSSLLKTFYYVAYKLDNNIIRVSKVADSTLYILFINLWPLYIVAIVLIICSILLGFLLRVFIENPFMS